MRTLSLALLFLAPPQDAPINAKCPVKPNQAARAANTLVFRGKTIGFC